MTTITSPPIPRTTAAATRTRESAGLIDQLLAALASLRLTVVLFALSIFLVFVGTLAQVDHDIWYVVEHSYFRVWFASVEWQTFVRLAEMFTKAEAAPVVGGFWFPGGKLIGVVMFANLLAAHALRFKVAAKGSRLVAGLAVLAAGVAATVWVIVSGIDTSLEGQLSPAFCDGLWQALRAALAGVTLLAAYWTTQSYGRLRPAEWGLLAAFDAVLLGVSAYLFAYPTAAPDDAGMRIVWQLTKCSGAAVLCLAGCWMVFRQRAGIVLLHAGIGLLMVGELVTDLSAVEGQMSIPEGGTVNYAQDIRRVELALVSDDGDAQRVTVVPQNLLASAARSGSVISHADLPFDLRVERFDENSFLAPADGAADNPATDGAGLQRVAIPSKSVVGVSNNAGVNRASAYVELLQKKSGESLGVWLVSNSFMPTAGGGGTSLLPQAIRVGDTNYEAELRFKRLYKDYSVTLKDFRFDRYAGTNVPKNFQSDIELRDPSRGVDRPVKIWMNNPLRYAGDTLYQSGFDEQTELSTVLQVVTNGGWMIPYVSCMFVGLGMLGHFGLTLMRFARRRVEEANRLAGKSDQPDPTAPGLFTAAACKSPLVWAPALAAVLTAAYFSSKALPSVDQPGAMAIERFGALPVAEGGRIKPIDTLARTTLQALSARQEVLPAKKGAARLSATEWLLDAISGRKGWQDHRVFRIENVELLDALGLEAREGSFRYSYGEVMADPKRLGDQVDQANEQRRKIAQEERDGLRPEPLAIVPKQTLELADKLSLFHQVVSAFGEPQIGGDGEVDLRQQLREAQARAEQLNRSGAARVVPPSDTAGEWTTLYQNGLMNLMKFAMKQPPDPAGVAWADALTAYARDDAQRFGDTLTDLEAAIEKYERSLAASPDAVAGMAPSERLDAGKVRFEHFFRAFSPFYHCAAMYLVAFVLTAAGWLGLGRWSRVLGRSAMAVILVTLAVHTFALVARIYISGRPPVTNLYSSAVFIGWAAVLFGVAFEWVYKLGVGGAVSSVLGFATLVVAHYLSLDGDTFTVLRAVLDTQFWLATHVVCITLGYSTTFLAGFLGAGYLLASCGPRLLGLRSRLDKPVADSLVRMIYGTLCFAILFSFVGTVLGGLWADDSWGRFWGWDPKENGALIIVLWNALVLHARWGKLVGPAGLAALAVGGNIVTTWSWFGVNELGVGLHAYGDSESSTAIWLLGFVLSQLVVIALATLRPLPRTS